MKKKDIFHMCVNNLLRRKSRTFLTVLGVIIGCCSIVIMVSLGIGMKESQTKMLSQMGDLTIITVTAPQDGKGKNKLDDALLKRIRAIPGVEALTPKQGLQEYSLKLYAGTGNRYVADWVTVSAMDITQMNKLGFSLTAGRNAQKDGEMIIGQYLAYNFKDTLRPDGSNMVDRWSGGWDENGNLINVPDAYFDPLKEPMTLEVETSSGKFTVKLNPVGIAKEDYSNGYETSEGILMSMADLRAILDKAQGSQKKNLPYDSILVKVKDISMVESVEKEVRNLGYNTESMESIRKPMEQEAKQKQMMLGGLGAISLFVAAIGITNTMIMSISERTREIGIMKSLGCFVGDIRILFLSEAGTIGLLGGIIGCIISFLASVTINLFSIGPPTPSNLWAAVAGGENISRVSVIPAWLLLFAIVFSVLIGLGSGYYPANKAVQIPALEAIKSE